MATVANTAQWPIPPEARPDFLANDPLALAASAEAGATAPDLADRLGTIAGRAAPAGPGAAGVSWRTAMTRVRMPSRRHPR